MSVTHYQVLIVCSCAAMVLSGLQYWRMRAEYEVARDAVNDRCGDLVDRACLRACTLDGGAP